MKNYICYDGVDGDIYYFETEAEAVAKLKELISQSVDCDEWMDGVECCFVAKITHCINPVKLEFEADEENDEQNRENFVDMRIKEVEAK